MSYQLDSILQLLNPDNTMSANRLLAHAIGLCEAIIYSSSLENNLIECKVKGIPAKRYFRISDNVQKLKSLLNKGVEITKKIKRTFK